MSVQTLTLTDFLLARIAEDEAVARVAIGKSWEPVTDDHGRKGTEHSVWTGSVVDGRYVAEVVLSASSAEHIARHDPARVLAECEAKRRIVEAYQDVRTRRDIFQADDARAVEDDEQATARRSAAARTRGLEIALEALALPYADHPDYDEAWRP